jgi:hypothetical protein
MEIRCCTEESVSEQCCGAGSPGHQGEVPTDARLQVLSERGSEQRFRILMAHAVAPWKRVIQNCGPASLGSRMAAYRAVTGYTLSTGSRTRRGAHRVFAWLFRRSSAFQFRFSGAARGRDSTILEGLARFIELVTVPLESLAQTECPVLSRYHVGSNAHDGPGSLAAT